MERLPGKLFRTDQRGLPPPPVKPLRGYADGRGRARTDGADGRKTFGRKKILTKKVPTNKFSDEQKSDRKSDRKFFRPRQRRFLRLRQRRFVRPRQRRFRGLRPRRFLRPRQRRFRGRRPRRIFRLRQRRFLRSRQRQFLRPRQRRLIVVSNQKSLPGRLFPRRNKIRHAQVLIPARNIDILFFQTVHGVPFFRATSPRPPFFP